MKQAQKRGKDMDKLKTLLGLLMEGVPLPANYLDHSLKGGWRGFRDAHIEPDWLLIYKIAGDVVRFERTGRHTDLFDERPYFPCSCRAEFIRPIVRMNSHLQNGRVAKKQHISSAQQKTRLFYRLMLGIRTTHRDNGIVC